MTRTMSLLIGGVWLSSGQVGASAEDIHIYNWEEFMSQGVIERFQAANDVAIFQQFFSDESIRDEVILSERGSAFDIVVIESVRLSILAEQGLFQNISELQGKLDGNFDKRWLEACGVYGIPYAWGTTGILYRTDRLEKPTSWATLYEPEESLSGRVSMYYEPTDLVGSALLYAQHDPFTDDIEALKSVYPILEHQAKHLYSNRYVIEYISKPNQLEEIDVAFGYGGDSYALNDVTEGAPWSYAVPKEGTTLWLECLAIVQKKEINPGAIEFVEFLSQPENAAVNAEDSWFSTPVTKARELASEDYSQDKELFPPQSVMERSFIYKRMKEDALRIRNRMTESLRK